MGKHRWKAGRRALTWLSIVAAAFFASPAAAGSVDRWSSQIAEASARFGIPEDWIRRVMRAESGGRTMLAGRPITSRAGAIGLMQLMPGTWAEMRAAHGLGPDPRDPRDNILAGTAYLCAMHDRFGYPGLFAAYNAGPARYAEYLAYGRRLPPETLAYVGAVGRMPPKEPTAPRQRRQSGGIFVALANSRRQPIAAPPPAAPNVVFVQLGSASPAPD